MYKLHCFIFHNPTYMYNFLEQNDKRQEFVIHMPHTLLYETILDLAESQYADFGKYCI